MYNFIHVFIAILKELEIITDEAANILSKELQDKIFSSSYSLTEEMVHDIVSKVDVVKAEAWRVHIEALETRVKELENKLAKTSKPPIAKIKVM